MPTLPDYSMADRAQRIWRKTHVPDHATGVQRFEAMRQWAEDLGVFPPSAQIRERRLREKIAIMMKWQRTAVGTV